MALGYTDVCKNIIQIMFFCLKYLHYSVLQLTQNADSPF